MIARNYPKKVDEYFQKIELTEEEIAYVWIDGNFTATIDTLNVYGGLDNVMYGLVNLKGV